MSLSRINPVNSLLLTLHVTKVRFRILSRYKGWFAFDFIFPIVFAALPILIGVSVAGGPGNAARAFKTNTGTSNYVIYLLIGSIVMMTVETSMWLVGYWLRWEREVGTIESIYLTPARRIQILTGVSLYSGMRSIFTFVGSYTFGCLLFGINPFQGEMLIAMLFLIAGLMPMWGIGFLYGAFILKVREAGSLINILGWGMAFLMGAYYPITVFPVTIQYLALAFPPTWMTNGIRSSLLHLSYFLGAWHWDLGVLVLYSIVMPLIGIWVFTAVEHRIKRNEGVGKF